MEAGRINLSQKIIKNLKEAAVTSKMLRRHTVGSDSDILEIALDFVV